MSGRSRGVTIRGRGFAISDYHPESLRRPGNHRPPSPSSFDLPHDRKTNEPPPLEVDDVLKELNTDSIDEKKLSGVAESFKSACRSEEQAKSAVEKLYKFSLLNKINAHYGALLVKLLGDFQVEGTKFKFNFLKRLQIDYEDRKRKYVNLDHFLNIVVFLCEVYHHLRIADGSCYAALSVPIIEYFGMLVDGGSEKEIETFVEQITKCSRSLQGQGPNVFDGLLLKIRKQIIGVSSVSSRSMLLQTFENILNDWKPLGSNAVNFYNVVCKQIVPICE